MAYDPSRCEYNGTAHQCDQGVCKRLETCPAFSGHTTGPWKATRSDPAEGYDVWWITGNHDAHNREKEICEVSGRDEANARLIAAAPDLLDALKEMVNWWEIDGGNLDRSLSKALAAIAKAED